MPRVQLHPAVIQSTRVIVGSVCRIAFTTAASAPLPVPGTRSRKGRSSAVAPLQYPRRRVFTAIAVAGHLYGVASDGRWCSKSGADPGSRPVPRDAGRPVPPCGVAAAVGHAPRPGLLAQLPATAQASVTQQPQLVVVVVAVAASPPFAAVRRARPGTQAKHAARAVCHDTPRSARAVSTRSVLRGAVRCAGKIERRGLPGREHPDRNLVHQRPGRSSQCAVLSSVLRLSRRCAVRGACEALQGHGGERRAPGEVAPCARHGAMQLPKQRHARAGVAIIHRCSPPARAPCLRAGGRASGCADFACHFTALVAARRTFH